jgi:hypothetical protein
MSNKALVPLGLIAAAGVMGSMVPGGQAARRKYANKRIEPAATLKLSTAHVPSATPEWADETYTKHEYGWVWFVNPDREPRAAWLKPIWRLAAKYKSDLVNFDADAFDYPHALPVYDWDES